MRKYLDLIYEIVKQYRRGKRTKTELTKGLIDVLRLARGDDSLTREDRYNLSCIAIQYMPF